MAALEVPEVPKYIFEVLIGADGRTTSLGNEHVIVCHEALAEVLIVALGGQRTIVAIAHLW